MTAQTTLPIHEAYTFASAHNLVAEVDAIRNMEIEWDLSYTTSVRRGFLIDLMITKGIFETFKDAHWPDGNTEWGRKKVAFLLSLKARYEDFLNGELEGTAAVEEEVAEQAFAAEADLRDFLARHLSTVESGLRLYVDGEREGIEFPVDRGRIDILAVDARGDFVVFELKLTKGRNKALGQLLYYMGWVETHLTTKPCRGVIIGREISDELRLAARRVKGVSLYRYNLSVTLDPVPVDGVA
jgi:hypothetical protein